MERVCPGQRAARDRLHKGLLDEYSERKEWGWRKEGRRREEKGTEKGKNRNGERKGRWNAKGGHLNSSRQIKGCIYFMIIRVTHKFNNRCFHMELPFISLSDLRESW